MGEKTEKADLWVSLKHESALECHSKDVSLALRHSSAQWINKYGNSEVHEDA